MVLLQARQLSLHDVEEKFCLQQVENADFFPEWQGVQPQLSTAEQQWLDQVKADFLAISKYPLHEEIVKLVVVAPVLSLAGLCRPPFLPSAEQQVEVTLADDNEIIRGRVDILVLHRQFWVTVIEAKRKGLDISEALPQALFYLLNNPHADSPTFGMVTNGSHFLFIKLLKGEEPQYALSDEFTLRRQSNELYQVVAILRHLGHWVTRET